ncbi:MAG: acyltransferase family protein [Eubacterium sp.]|nr:acyltransferase family protein [Eubacterium sp.]
MKEERIYYWDNLKCFLIFLVVFGHVLLPFRMNGICFKKICVFIYFFHMPAFVFISGFFAKNYMKKDVPDIRKLNGFLILYVAYETLIAVEQTLINGVALDIPLFRPSGSPWYLLTMFMWYLIIPIFAKIKPVFGMIISILMGLGIGFIEYFDAFFAGSRMFVFFPFFLLGFYVNPGIVEKITNWKVKIVAALLLVGSVFLFLWKWELIKKNELMIYGSSDYYRSPQGPVEPWGNLIFRLVWYVIVTLIIFGIMSLIPKKKFSFSYVGSRTLPIYFLHVPIREALMICYRKNMIHLENEYIMIVFQFLLSIGLVAILSGNTLNKFFNLPFKISYRKILVEEETKPSQGFFE